MPIRGMTPQDYDEQFTADGFRKKQDGQPDIRDYSYFRERIGALIHELDQLEAEIRQKETQVVPGRESIDPSTFAEMREVYFKVLKDLDKAHNERNKAVLHRGLDRLSIIINESRAKLGLDKDVERGNAISKEVMDVVRLDNNLQIFAEACRQFSDSFIDDTVVGELDYNIQAELLKEKQKYHKPRPK